MGVGGLEEKRSPGPDEERGVGNAVGLDLYIFYVIE